MVLIKSMRLRFWLRIHAVRTVQFGLALFGAMSMALGQTSPDNQNQKIVLTPQENANQARAPLASEKLNYQSPYMQHAPLAAFSVGSLAIGMVFYGLQHSTQDPKVGFMPKDKASLGTAIGAAGFTALIAGVSYFYYSNRDVQRATGWDAAISGSLEPEGKMNLSAALIMPLSFLKL